MEYLIQYKSDNKFIIYENNREIIQVKRKHLWSGKLISTFTASGDLLMESTLSTKFSGKDISLAIWADWIDLSVEKRKRSIIGFHKETTIFIEGYLFDGIRYVILENDLIVAEIRENSERAIVRFVRESVSELHGVLFFLINRGSFT